MLQQRCSLDRNEWMEAAARRNERIVVWFIQCGMEPFGFSAMSRRAIGWKETTRIMYVFASRYATCDVRHEPNKCTEQSNEQYLNPLRLSSSNLHFALVSFMFMCTTFNWEQLQAHTHEQKGQNNLQSKLLVIKLAEMIIVMVICGIQIALFISHTQNNSNNNDLRSIIIT